MTTDKRIEAFKELNKAKQNVQWLLEHPDSLVDMHGLEYWAERVEELRQEIRRAI